MSQLTGGQLQKIKSQWGGEESSCHQKPIWPFYLCQEWCVDIITPNELWLCASGWDSDQRVLKRDFVFLNWMVIHLKSKDAESVMFLSLSSLHTGMRLLTSGLPLRLRRMSESVPNTLNYKQTQMPQIPLSLETVGWPRVPLCLGYFYLLAPSGQC